MKKPVKKTKTATTKTNALKKNAMIKALEKCLGNVTMAARSIGIDRCTHYEWMNLDKDYKRAIDDIQLNILPDYLESKIYKLCDNLNPTAIIFALKCKAKHRGWSEGEAQQETTNETNEVIIE